MKFCHNCGIPKEFENQNFCPACGTKMISEILNNSPRPRSSNAELFNFLETSPGIVFLSDPSEPFYNRSNPYVSLINLEDMLEEDEVLDESNCHECQKFFDDGLMWLIENAPDTYCLLCMNCIRDLLTDREVFATSIYPYQYQDWADSALRPSAVAFTSFHWEAISYRNGDGAEVASCWNCGNTGTTVNLGAPHWEITLSNGSPDAHAVPICGSCADNCALLISTPEIAGLL